MHELVIVLSDLYLPPASEELGDGLAGARPMKGLERAARFGHHSALAGGWRSWLAGTLRPGVFAGENLLPVSPASVAARDAASRTRSARTSTPDPGTTVWLATPVHLLTGLTSLHFDRRSILHLPREQTELLAAQFLQVFGDSGFRLEPLDSGDFLLFGPSMSVPQTREPARCIGEEVAAALPRGPGSEQVRRLSAEIEMWLHEHPVNLTRRSHAELPVTTLWIWGGGPAVGGVVAAEAGDRDSPLSLREPLDAIFANDAFVSGLCAGFAPILRLPRQLSEVFGYSRVRRAVLVLELGEMLQSNAGWTFLDVLSEIDRRFLSPALEALERRTLEQVSILGNDRLLRLSAYDRLKFWRRSLPGLSGLQ